MKIKVLRLGHAARHVEAAAGSTIAEILEANDISSQGYSISVNGLGASANTALEDGDSLVLVAKIEGGSK